MCYFFGWQIEIDRYIRSCLSQGGHSPGKPGKVKEFKSGQGKVSENRRSQGTVRENVFLHVAYYTIILKL